MGNQEVQVALHETCEMPDTFGLQEYFISDIATEIDGPNVRIVCGARRGGQVHWLYSVIMRWDRLAAACDELSQTATEARSLLSMIVRRGGH